jgi:RNA polymerase sigma-70 factor (ECF subfamily)
MTTTDTALLTAARGGDRKAFDQLFGAHVPQLRGVLHRLVGHPDDVDDLAQQALLRAYEAVGSFRGESAAGTWLCSIGTRLAIDHLRARKRWRERAQIIFASECLKSPELGAGVGAAFGHPGFRFEVAEHVAYCFTCVGRSLDPEQQAALVLRDVLGLDNDEAAQALGLSRSAFRHRLAAAREAMQRSYEGLCALVNQRGPCWQCAGLREAVPEALRGPAAPKTLDWPRRLELVREATSAARATQALHDLFFRSTEAQEQEGRGDASAETDCGRPDADADADGGDA